MSSFVENLQDRVLRLVTSILDQNSITAEVLPDSRLVEMGLNSMDMVRLMLSVEAEFDLTLPQSEITPDNFRSVEMIERMVAKQLKLQGRSWLNTSSGHDIALEAD